MVMAKEVKLIMRPGEIAIRIEKRWIARHRLVQQIDYLREIGERAPPIIICARIKLESDEIAGRFAFDRQFLSR
jgi:hypothetical protein